MLENDYIEFNYVDQKKDGIEAWIRYRGNKWIRLDFMLEYFISNNVEITKRYKGKIKNTIIAKRFYDELFEKFKKETNQGIDFDYENYNSWMKNSSEIEKVRGLLK